jgi:hypothetical protein
MIDRFGYERSADGRLSAPVWHVYIRRLGMADTYLGTAQGSSDEDAMEAVLTERHRKGADPVDGMELVALEVDATWFDQ